MQKISRSGIISFLFSDLPYLFLHYLIYTPLESQSSSLLGKYDWWEYVHYVFRHIKVREKYRRRIPSPKIWSLSPLKSECSDIWNFLSADRTLKLFQILENLTLWIFGLGMLNWSLCKCSKFWKLWNLKYLTFQTFQVRDA